MSSLRVLKRDLPLRLKDPSKTRVTRTRAQCLPVSAPPAAMRDLTEGQTLFAPKPRSSSLVDRATPGLPTDLVTRGATRLQISASLYAFTFFMAAFFPRLI